MSLGPGAVFGLRRLCISYRLLFSLAARTTRRLRQRRYLLPCYCSRDAAFPGHYAVYHGDGMIVEDEGASAEKIGESFYKDWLARTGLTTGKNGKATLAAQAR